MEALRFEYAMTEMHKLTTISFEKYVSVFLLNSKPKEGDNKSDKQIYNMISTIDYLSRSEKMVFSQYERYQKDCNLLFTKCNELYMQLIDFCQNKEKLITENKINDSNEKDFYLKIFKLVEGYVTKINDPENKDKRALILYSNLIDPIRDEIIPNKDISSFIELIKIISSFDLIKRQWESNKIGYSQIFKDYSSAISKVYTKLEDSVNYFKEKTKAKW